MNVALDRTTLQGRFAGALIGESTATAIAAGGDTDATAAMAGALSGARIGLQAIPPDFARIVHDANEWGYDALVDLAHRAASGMAEGSSG